MRSCRYTLLAAVAALSLPLFAQQTKTLLATPETIAWGNYSGSAKPALTVQSGDTVIMQTLSTCGAANALKARGVKDADIPAYVQDIYEHFPADKKGPGGHILTGPVAIEGAEPGDILEVRIQKIDIDVPWACNGWGPGHSFLPNEFPYSHTKLIPLDRQKMIGHFGPGIDIPLHPFFGSMGIAASGGKTDSAPPWYNAGNMDNKELVAGTTLFLPVATRGANFEAGDGHAGQGNGEVDITAMETMLTGTFQFILHKGSVDDQHRLLWPRAETPTQYIAMGFHEDLKSATEMAVRNMITFLSEQMTDHPRLSRDDAYALVSVACDVDITQVVDLPRVGVHVMCPKAIFTTTK
jgi:acetamidase/formamidase